MAHQSKHVEVTLTLKSGEQFKRSFAVAIWNGHASPLEIQLDEAGYMGKPPGSATVLVERRLDLWARGSGCILEIPDKTLSDVASIHMAF